MPRQVKKNIFCSDKSLKITLRDKKIYFERDGENILTLENNWYNTSACLSALVEFLQKTRGIKFDRISTIGENHYETEEIPQKTDEANNTNIDWANANNEMLKES